MTNDKLLREQLKQLLESRNAHMPFEDAVAGFPMELINTRPTHVPYTFWHLIEHLRIAQHDILDFCRNPNYVELNWPDDYWPARDAEATPADWQHSVEQFLADKAALVAIIEDPAIDPFAELEHAPGYTILREVLVVADHNAYHIGELGILRQVMGAWPADHES